MYRAEINERIILRKIKKSLSSENAAKGKVEREQMEIIMKYRKITAMYNSEIRTSTFAILLNDS